jgi:hypothetical protein
VVTNPKLKRIVPRTPACDPVVGLELYLVRRDQRL